MRCGEYEALILDSLDGGLGADQRRALEVHLAGCAGCREFSLIQQRLDAALRERLPELAASADFEQCVLARVEAEGEWLRWLGSVVLDTAGIAGLTAAALVALDYVLAQPGVASALPRLGVYAAWAAGGLGLAYLVWVGLRGKTAVSPY